MLAAIFGLVGVLIGAAGTSGTAFFMARREERFALRAALRLLCADLLKVQAIIEPVRRAGGWGPERSPLPTDGYEIHAAVLARKLPSDEWKRVEGSVLGVRRLEGIREDCVTTGRPITGTELADFERIGSYIDQTIAVFDQRM